MASINSPYRIWHHPCPKKFCIEYIVTSLLLKEDARGFDAVAGILAKNSFNCNLLAFLNQKYELTPRPLWILNVLRQTLQCLVTKPHSGFLSVLNEDLDKKITLVAVGGTAMTLLDLKPSTIDIDFIISGYDRVEFEQALKEASYRLSS